MRRNSDPLCIGQKQRWFMLRLLSPPDKLRFDLGEEPEFDRARWSRDEYDHRAAERQRETVHTASGEVGGSERRRGRPLTAA